MREALVGLTLAFMLLGGYVLAGDEEDAIMRAHPCWAQACNW